MQKPNVPFFNLEDFVPELRQVFAERPMNPDKLLQIAIPVKDPKKHPSLIPAGGNRRSISFTDGKEFWFWETDSLLFRTR